MQFPWPQSATEAQKAAVEQAVLDVRAPFMSPERTQKLAGGRSIAETPDPANKTNTPRRGARFAVLLQTLCDPAGVESVLDIASGGVTGAQPPANISHPSGMKQCTLADLYDPVAMPPSLSKAHTELDRAVDRCYRKDPFPSDRARVEFLFQLYEQLTAPLLPATKPKRARKRTA